MTNPGVDRHKAPSSSEEGVGGGVSREVMLSRAARLRRDPTEPEIRLWRALRGKQCKGYKFRRQTVIGTRIVDFFCPGKGLVVELDGNTHDPGIDRRRDAMLAEGYGYQTVRFTNEDVMRNLDGVIVELLGILEQLPDRWSGRPRHHPPTPSSEEEGGIVIARQIDRSDHSGPLRQLSGDGTGLRNGRNVVVSCQPAFVCGLRYS